MKPEQIIMFVDDALYNIVKLKVELAWMHYDEEVAKLNEIAEVLYASLGPETAKSFREHYTECEALKKELWDTKREEEKIRDRLLFEVYRQKEEN